MKKNILLACFLALIITGCSSPTPLMRKLQAARDMGYEKAKTLSEEYAKLASQNAALAIFEINLSAVDLRTIAEASKGLKIVMGASEVGNIYLILEQRQSNNRKVWYYLDDVFKSTDFGADNDPPLCQPLPTCRPQFPPQGQQSPISAEEATNSAARYYTMSSTDPGSIIQQIDLDPSIMISLLTDITNVKLIPGVRADGSPTLLLKLTKGNVVKYDDLKRYLPNPVCPPPGGCTITSVYAPSVISL